MTIFKDIYLVFCKPAGKGLRVRYAANLASKTARYIVFSPVFLIAALLGIVHGLASAINDFFDGPVMDAAGEIGDKLGIHDWQARDAVAFDQIAKEYRANMKALDE